MTATASAPSATAAIVAFAAHAYAFREPVRAQGRAVVLGTLLGATAGARSTRVEIAAATADNGASRMPARAVGRPAYTSPLQAAFLTALSAGDEATLVTPAVCAALAIGESIDAAGAIALDAVIAGAEIAVRVSTALGGGHRKRGWDERGTCGRIGAAIAAARVLGLRAEALRNAVGIAATAAGGLLSARGTMTAAFVAAAAAADGVEAALLARAGFTGAPLALEGRRGLAALTADAFDASAVVHGLGTTFTFGTSNATGVAGASGPRFEAIRAQADRIDRLPSLRELIEATLLT
jgi:2-methylcitrate dehydratase PrpD